MPAPLKLSTLAQVWLRRSAWGALILLGVGALALGGAVALYGPDLPPLDRVTAYRPRQPLQVFTADLVEIAQFGAERRQFMSIDQIPQQLQLAVLAVEDARFRGHLGIDPIGVVRAVVANLTGGLRQGASTITQQVARTFFLSSRLTPERKVKEALLALRIEQQLSKDQILELYMNQIFLGQRAYGFAAAADTYFGKPLVSLSLAENALLAGLPQNPAYANPITNLARAVQRQHIVLMRMQVTGAITEAQALAARAEKLKIRSLLQVPLHAEHVAEMARLMVVERFGAEVYSQGIKVYTTLRADDQQAAWAALRRGVLAYDGRQPWRGPEDQEDLPPEGTPDIERTAALALKDYQDDSGLRVAIVLVANPRELLVQLATGEQLRISGDSLRAVQAALGTDAPPERAITRGSIVRVMQMRETPGKAAGDGAGPWALTQWPDVQAALVAMDSATGRVRALVGGFDFARQPFNHVTQAWRQPGSTFKPFLYSAALEHGVMPATLINDAPLDSTDGWDPQNADGRFDGPMTLREALVRSRNLVSIRLLRQVGVGIARDWLERFGFDLGRHPNNLTMALGAGSITPMQMAQAYAVLANGGWQVTPVVIERITDAQGKLLFEAPPAAALTEDKRAVPARNVFIINSLLNDVTRVGTAARAQQQLQRADLYGKTGTTNDAVDAWFAGFQPAMVAVAWMGHDEPQTLGGRESGGGLALPIWIDFMAQALKRVPVAPAPTPPEGVVRVADDWTYSEWAAGGAVASIGLDTSAVWPAALTAQAAQATPATPAAPAASAGSPVPPAPPPNLPAALQGTAPTVSLTPGERR